MKKYIFIFISLISVSIIVAQPGNDDCLSAQDIGALPSPSCSVSVGFGAPVTITGTLVGAIPSSQYHYLTSCSGAGGSVMSNPANDVWYKFTATGYQLVVNVTSTFSNPNVALFSGSCTSLYAAVGGCAVGTGGTVSLTVEQLTIGDTYYLLISGNGAQTGTFNFNIKNNFDCADCLVSSNLNLTPLPINGTYTVGQTVDFCYHISEYLQINTNWLHGVQINFGAGWNLSTLTTTPPTSCQGSGVWFYSPTPIISSGTGMTWPAGFYFDANSDGNPGNNYGDNCTGVMPSSEWNFCFSIQTIADSNLRIVINTTGDGESGSWSSIGCLDDPNYIFDISNISGIATQTTEINSNIKTTIYPNPVSAKSKLSISSKSILQDARLIVYNINGLETMQIPINNNEATIEKDGLSSGIYFYRLISLNEFKGSGKFIIK